MCAIDLVVFDIVGTTIEDGGQVLQAFLTALREIGIEVTEGELQPWRGASKREVLKAFIEMQFGPDDAENAARIEQAYARFREGLENAYLDQGVILIDGVQETFDWMRERDVKIALTTGFYRKVTDIILHAAGWDGSIISASVCSDEVPQGRPAPYMIFRAMEVTSVIDVRRAVKVGDTTHDLLAGTHAGLRGVVGVLSGSHDMKQLAGVPHSHIIASVSDLPGLLTASFV